MTLGGNGKGQGGGNGQGQGGRKPGGKHRSPGDWKFLKNHRKMLVHMKQRGEDQLQMAVSACKGAEQHFREEKNKETLDLLYDASRMVIDRQMILLGTP